MITDKVSNIIFDLDGTLLNTLDDLAASTNYALETCGYPRRSLEEVRCFVGNGVGKLIERAVPDSTDADATGHCLSVFREHYTFHCLDRTLPYPGIIDLLNALRQRGIGMAIVSNKLQPAVAELNQRFFAPVISIAIGETAQLRRKPAPDMLLQALSQLNAIGDETLYVGDSDVDIQTARNAHLPCVSVAWGFRSRQFVADHGAATIIDSPQQLLTMIDTIGSKIPK